MASRGPIRITVLLGVLVVGWLGWRSYSSHARTAETSAPAIDKQPVVFTTRTFDPGAPPSDLPPLTPGESAECDSDFQSNASVAGETRQTDATHGTVTVTGVRMTLNLNVTVWVPTSVSEHVIEHEEGHHQISEYYYKMADRVAERIANTYIGKEVDISGDDLGEASNKMLRQMATEITDEYNKELNPGPTQLLYDSITDHGRNEVVVKDAVASAIKNVTIASN